MKDKELNTVLEKILLFKDAQKNFNPTLLAMSSDSF